VSALRLTRAEMPKVGDLTRDRSNAALAASFAMIAADFCKLLTEVCGCAFDCSSAVNAADSMDTARVRGHSQKSFCCPFCFSALYAAAIASGDRCRRFSSRCENGASPNQYRCNCLNVESLPGTIPPAILRKVRPLAARVVPANAGGSSSAVAETQSGLPGPRLRRGTVRWCPPWFPP
jgi:hypothetical protein